MRVRSFKINLEALQSELFRFIIDTLEWKIHIIERPVIKKHEFESQSWFFSFQNEISYQQNRDLLTNLSFADAKDILEANKDTSALELVLTRRYNNLKIRDFA